MNLKSTAGLLPITISVIFIFSAILILNQTEISAQPSDPIGFEELDDGKVWHIWNPHDDYYFNATSGIQFSNHYNEFWTHNIFCGGYKDAGGEWHYDCNDALPFNWSYDTDNATYVNITGWRNKVIGTKTVRVALRYHLKLNDRNLTITPYIKNIGSSDISQDLGFAWRVNNIQIGNDTENDQIEINDTFYWLNESLSINFTNMTALRANITINATCWDECNQTYDNETYCTELCTIIENYTAYIPYYIMFDENRGKFLRLDWNKNLTYKVMLSSTEQYNTPTTLGINIGPLSVGQEKSTEFYWIDAESNLVPNSDIQTDWTAQGGSSHFKEIDEDISSPITSDYIYTSAASKTDEWGFTDCPSDVGTVTALTVRLHIKKDAGGQVLYADVNYSTDGGSTYSSTKNTGTFPTSATTVDLTWTGLSLSKQECDALQVQVRTKVSVIGIPVNHYIYTANANITYDAVPNVTLSSPPDSSTDNDGSVTFACNVTDDNVIDNVTLYHNISGSFIANQTALLEKGFFENCSDISDWTTTGGWIVSGNQCLDQALGQQHNMTSPTIDLSAINILYPNITFDYVFNKGQAGDEFKVYVNSSVDVWTKVFSIISTGSGSKEFNLSKFITLDSGVHLRGYCNMGFGLGSYCKWDNINVTAYMDDGTSQTSYNVTFNEITGISDGSYKWNCLAYDNASGSDWADSNWTFTVDATSPQYSNNQTNTTLAGEPTLFSLYWTDNYGLSGYIFSFDNGTGTFTNDSWTAMTGASNWSNVTKVVNSTEGSTIRWIVYANDTANNWNTSDTYQYITDGPPTVTLSSPPDSSTDNDGSVTFACNVTDDKVIENVTLYHNISGWAANQTFTPPIESFENCDDISDWTVTGGWASASNQCRDTTTVENNMTSQSIDLSADNINYANLTFEYDYNCGLCGPLNYFRVWANSSTSGWVKIFERTTDSGGLQSEEITLPKDITLDEGVHIRGSCDAETLGGSCIWDNINVTTYMSDSSSYSQTSYNVTFNEITGISDGSYKWNCLAYDSAPQSAWASSNWTFTVDATSPQYSNNQTNTTLAGEPTLFSLYWTDNYGLSGYIFSFDNGTGTFSNDSWVEMTGASNWSNVTKIVNSTVGSTIRWIVYANDTNDNWNISDTYQYITTNHPPTHTTPIITPDPAYTNNNITCTNQSTSDVDGDTVTNIYNWLKNGTSITLLNMPFDTNVSTAGTKVKDYSGYGNDGGLNSGTAMPTWTTDGKLGGAYSFDGGDFLNISKSSSLNDTYDFTITFWMKPANTGSGDRHILTNDDNAILTESGEFRIYQSTDDILYEDSNSSISAYERNSLTAGSWTHVAVVIIDGVNVTVYTDGAHLDTADILIGPGPYWNSSNDFFVGALGNGGKNFNGTLDDLRVYNYSLSPQQIYQLYLEGLNNYTNSTIVSQETLGGQNWTCEVTPNDATDDGQTLSNSSIIQPCSLAIGLSDTFGPPDGNINWTITSLPSTNISAEGNNGTGITLYNVSIEATGCTADVYIKANDDLRSNGNSIGLGNETYCHNTTNNTVPGSACTQFDTTYAGNPIGSNLGGGYIYLKFYLSIPSAQPAGSYNNSISIKGVKNGETP